MVESLHFGCEKRTRSHSFKSRLNYIFEDICSIAKKIGDLDGDDKQGFC